MTAIAKVQRSYIGTCISAGKLPGVVQVRVSKSVWNKKVDKFFTAPFNLLAHDGGSAARIGDIVRIDLVNYKQHASAVRRELGAILAPYRIPLNERRSSDADLHPRLDSESTTTSSNQTNSTGQSDQELGSELENRLSNDWPVKVQSADERLRAWRELDSKKYELKLAKRRLIKEVSEKKVADRNSRMSRVVAVRHDQAQQGVAERKEQLVQLLVAQLEQVKLKVGR